MIILGVGQDGEPVMMEKLHDSCVLIHCAGNASSPFEFNGDAGKSAEENARQFAKLLYVARVEDSLEAMAAKDPQVQQDMEAIERAFNSTELDGLDES